MTIKSPLQLLLATNYKLPFLLLTTLYLLLTTPTTLANFTDVPDSYLYKDAVNFVQQAGRVSGYPDNTFKPDNTINRAEFTKMYINSIQFPGMEESCITENIPKGAETVFFPDVPVDSWFAPYICVAKTKGLIQGYPDGNFRPDDKIEFAEAAKILTKLENVREAYESESWYVPYVEYLLEHGAIPETIDVPHKFITRGEVAEMMYQMDGNTYEQMYSLKEKTVTEDTNSYELNIKYPEFSWHSSESASDVEKKAAQDLTALITKTINDTIDTFKSEAYTNEEVGIEKNSLYITYYPVFSGGDKLVSIKFTVSTYSGGAHPNSYTEVINYDLSKNRAITLEDLFLPGSEYLDELSNVAPHYITSSFVWRGETDPDTDWIATGTSPEKTSFKNFNIKPTGLVLTFDPYQVAPYAAGTTEITIPYAALKNIMRDETPLSHF